MDGFMLRVLRPTGQGLFLQSYCISSIHGGQMWGGTNTWTCEVERSRSPSREQRMEHDSREGGVRVVPGATTELPSNRDHIN